MVEGLVAIVVEIVVVVDAGRWVVGVVVIVAPCAVVVRGVRL